MNFDELSEPNRSLNRIARLMHVTNVFIFKKTYKLSMSLLSIGVTDTILWHFRRQRISPVVCTKPAISTRRATWYNSASTFHLLSQLIPENPAKQEHVYELWLSKHVPPFLQGLLRHLLSTAKIEKKRRPKLRIFSIRKVFLRFIYVWTLSIRSSRFFFLTDQASKAPVCAARKVYKLLLETVVNTHCISKSTILHFFRRLKFCPSIYASVWLSITFM